MKARILHHSDVLKIVDLLRAEGYEVIAPFHGRGRDTYFDTVNDQNRGRVQIHLPNPYYPPKRFVFPHIERLMKFQKNNGEIQIEPAYEQPKRAIFGIRSCDLAGIYHLDRFYLGREFRDIYYENHRKNLFLVNVVCSYSVLGPVEKIIPVNYYIPGCPPRPEAIIYGVAVALGLVDKKIAPVEFKELELPIPRYHPDELRGKGELVIYEKAEKV